MGSASRGSVQRFFLKKATRIDAGCLVISDKHRLNYFRGCLRILSSPSVEAVSDQSTLHLLVPFERGACYRQSHHFKSFAYPMDGGDAIAKY